MAFDPKCTDPVARSQNALALARAGAAHSGGALELSGPQLATRDGGQPLEGHLTS
jgi:hypothetical protein